MTEHNTIMCSTFRLWICDSTLKAWRRNEISTFLNYAILKFCKCVHWEGRAKTSIYPYMHTLSVILRNYLIIHNFRCQEDEERESHPLVQKILEILYATEVTGCFLKTQY